MSDAAISPRLSADAWLDAGLQALCLDGPTVLRAEVLARRLGVTKGSFYWHFADVGAFHDALLARWSQAVLALAEELATASQTETAHLRNLCQMVAGGGKDNPWQAIRAWAQSHPKASQTVAQVDARILQQVERLLSGLGIGNPEMARIVYAAAIGLAGMDDVDPVQNAQAAGTLIDLVLALR